MPKGPSKNDPVVDVVAVWERGHEPVPTLAEQLATSLPPVVRHDQRTVTAGEAAELFGKSPLADLPAEPPAGLEPGSDVPAEAGPPEPVALDGLEQFAQPDPDDAHVLPLEIFQETIDRTNQQIASSLAAAALTDLGPPGETPEATLARRQREAGIVLPSGSLEVLQACASGHESPGGAKFCMECGEPFAVRAGPPAEWTCSSGHLIDGAAKFCMECGDQRPDLQAPVSGAGFAAELAARVVPSEELTPAGRAERERQHAAAVRLGRQDAPLVYEPPTGQRPTILFHVLKSGWTFAGQVWYRGQEIELEEGSSRWQEAQRFINWTDAEQFEQYGRLAWRLGPWPGKQSYAAEGPDSYQRLSPLSKNGAEVRGPSEEQLRQADAMEARRGRGVPRPMFQQARG